METSLNAIRVFEVAARHLSFVRAARQLGVQAPAVSRQVAELEKSLGTRLFVRSKPRMALTSQGQELYLAASTGLKQIRQACDKLRNGDRQNRIKVITSISITSCWLLRRLIGFYQQHPDIDLQLTTRDSTFELDPKDADVAIVFGETDLPGVEQRNIFRETMIPVCHPAFLPAGIPFSAEALLAQPLLHYLEPTHRGDWRRLLASVGLEVPPPGRGASFNSYVVYLQAAINGDGIAIGWEHLLEDYLDGGSLCRAADIRLTTRQGYFCCLTEQGTDNPAARQFSDWGCSLVDRSGEYP